MTFLLRLKTNDIFCSWLKTKNVSTKCVFSISDPPPPLCLHLRLSRDKWYQAFPLRFCILQEIKIWTVGKAWEQGYPVNRTQWKGNDLNRNEKQKRSSTMGILLWAWRQGVFWSDQRCLQQHPSQYHDQILEKGEWKVGQFMLAAST